MSVICSKSPSIVRYINHSLSLLSPLPPPSPIVSTLSVKKSSQVEQSTSANLQYNFDGSLLIYIDGSCGGNGKSNARAGVGVYFAENHPLNVAKLVQRQHSNNNAEIEAALVALQQAKTLDVSKVRLCTDSTLLISCFTEWTPKWKRSN